MVRHLLAALISSLAVSGAAQASGVSECSQSSECSGGIRLLAARYLGPETGVSILVFKRDNDSEVYGAATNIDPGDLVFADASARGDAKLPANIELRVSQGGGLLEQVELHVSCSQPITPGQAVGSHLQLVCFDSLNLDTDDTCHLDLSGGLACSDEPEICDDGIDNDSDSDVDCDDSECLGFPGCPTPECSRSGECSGGIRFLSARYLGPETDADLQVFKRGKDDEVYGTAMSLGPGDLIFVSASGHSKTKLPASIEFRMSSGGTVVEQVELHVSCSQPIAPGQAVGSRLELVCFDSLGVSGDDLCRLDSQGTLVCTDVPEDCANGIDDDGDGKVDCADPDCEARSCDDGDRCTRGDECQGGACAGAPVVCPAAQPPCEGGQQCDPGTGLCEDRPDPSPSTPCEADGDLCTTDHCDGSGACVPEAPVACQSASPPCEGGEECNPATGGCEPLADAPPGTPCEADGDACTNDRCDESGGCVLESRVECPGDTCAAGVCDPGTGDCALEPITPCCGNDVEEELEECDGTDDAACPGGACGPPGSPDECLCTGGFCGDGITDPNRGEECDPPVPDMQEICDNRLDDDGDDLVDCRDPDCPAFCEHDGVVDANQPCTTHRECRQEFGRAASCVSQGTCGSECVFVNLCSRIDRDPARIKFGTAGKPDLFTIHGRFVVPAEADAAAKGFSIRLSNATGTIYEGTLLPGDMIRKRRSAYRWKDRNARLDGGLRDGLEKVLVKFRTVKGKLNLSFKAKAWADLSGATEPLMAIEVRVGAAGGFHEAEWRPQSHGWFLDGRDF